MDWDTHVHEWHAGGVTREGWFAIAAGAPVDFLHSPRGVRRYEQVLWVASGSLGLLVSAVWEVSMSTTSVKEEARRLIEHLPDDATWEDLQYEIYVRQAIEAGVKDSQEGRTVPVAEARRRFGLDSK